MQAPFIHELDFAQAQRRLHLAWRRGKDHFPCNTGRERSLRDGGDRVHPESFTAMVVADALREWPEHAALVRDVLSMLEHELGEDDVFHFFKQHERLPADADCTALGLSVLLLDGVGGDRLRATAHRALDRILDNVDAAGVVATYFDPTGERSGIVDPVVCTNSLFLAYLLRRGAEARQTLDHVHRVLVEGRYLEGTRYYHGPDSFLYFLGRVVRCFPETHARLRRPLQAAVLERLGSSGHPIDVAQRVTLCAWLQLDDRGEAARLARGRQADGCWPADALFRYGREPVYFGSRALATAFAVAALRASRRASAATILEAGEGPAANDPGQGHALG